MKRSLVWMMLLLVLLLTSCNKSLDKEASQPTPSATSLQDDVTAAVTAEAKNSISPKETPAAQSGSASPSPMMMPGKSEWLGEWNWDKSNEFYGSTITIASMDQDKITFELSAFHMTNPEKTHANIGNIPHNTATVVGNEATFTDGSFQLIMKLVDDHLQVKTIGGGYFGAGVLVDGTYSRTDHAKAQTVKSDYLIVPGKSVGKVALGMSKNDMKRLLGKPTKEDATTVTYSSQTNHIIMHMKNDSVAQIEFTSPAFVTADGIGTKNLDEHTEQFRKYEFQWRFMNQRFTWKSGGLSFITFNADVPDGNTEYQRYTRGYVYAGGNMYNEPIPDAKWESVP